MANLLSLEANLLLTSLFYAPLLPITIPIAFLGLVCSYWVEKFNLLKVHRVPEMLNGVLTMFFSNLLPYFAFLWSIMFFATSVNYNEKREEEGRDELRLRVLPLVAIIVSTIFILFPIRTIINWCFSD